MLSFASDYTEGACEEILQKLAETNRESLPGYGMYDGWIKELQSEAE